MPSSRGTRVRIAGCSPVSSLPQAGRGARCAFRPGFAASFLLLTRSSVQRQTRRPTLGATPDPPWRALGLRSVTRCSAGPRPRPRSHPRAQRSAGKNSWSLGPSEVLRPGSASVETGIWKGRRMAARALVCGVRSVSSRPRGPAPRKQRPVGPDTPRVLGFPMEQVRARPLGCRVWTARATQLALGKHNRRKIQVGSVPYRQ